MGNKTRINKVIVMIKKLLSIFEKPRSTSVLPWGKKSTSVSLHSCTVFFYVHRLAISNKSIVLGNLKYICFAGESLTIFGTFEMLFMH